MNLYVQFRKLLPTSPLLVATVTAVHGDGSVTVQTPAGASTRVRGEGVIVGESVFVQAGRVVEIAPNLPVFYETV